MDSGDFNQQNVLKQLRESKNFANQKQYIAFMADYFNNNSLGTERDSIAINDKLLLQFKSRDNNLLKDITQDDLIEEIRYIKVQLNKRCRINASIGKFSTNNVGILQYSFQQNFTDSGLSGIDRIKVPGGYLETSKYQYCASVFPSIEDMVKFAAYEETEINATITFTADQRYIRALVANTAIQTKKIKIDEPTKKALDFVMVGYNLYKAAPKAIILCAVEKLAETALRSAGYNVPSVPLLILIPASIIAACLIESYRNSAVSVQK